jgi:predicted ArsR family transcriptional regulator
MSEAIREPGEGTTRAAIVRLLKTEGAMDSSRLAERLGLTAMAVRQHLYALHDDKFVTAEERAGAVGRPTKYWRLTPEADRFFPAAYAELSVALIDALGDAFGPAGLKRVLESRRARQELAYSELIASDAPLAEKVQHLAQVRTKEGYMAEVKREGKTSFLLIENHCPICAAATACKGLCETELDLFRRVLGPAIGVERIEHIVSGDRRCAYRITPAGREARVRIVSK